MLRFKPVPPGVSAEELRRRQGGSSAVAEQDETNQQTQANQQWFNQQIFRDLPV